jgi:hypothetical protein
MVDIECAEYRNPITVSTSGSRERPPVRVRLIAQVADYQPHTLATVTADTPDQLKAAIPAVLAELTDAVIDAIDRSNW